MMNACLLIKCPVRKGQWAVPGFVKGHGLIASDTCHQRKCRARVQQLLSPAPGAGARCGTAPYSARPASASASRSTPLCAAAQSCINRRESIRQIHPDHEAKRHLSNPKATSRRHLNRCSETDGKALPRKQLNAKSAKCLEEKNNLNKKSWECNDLNLT